MRARRSSIRSTSRSWASMASLSSRSRSTIGAPLCTRLASPIDGVLGLEHRSDLGQGETQQLLKFADAGDPSELGG